MKRNRTPGVVDLAAAGLVAARVVGDLHVGDLRQVLRDGVGEFALHALHVVMSCCSHRLGEPTSISAIACAVRLR